MADEPLRVLICDDEPGMRLILGKLVGKAEGFEVVGEAENGEQALEMFEKTHPQVVFLDVEMPVMDGVETARRIQDMDPHAALAWLLSHDEVTTVLIGASKTSQILDNIKAVQNTSFTAEELEAIDRISK